MTTPRQSEPGQPAILSRRNFANPEELAAGLAADIASALRRGIAGRGVAGLLVSGGSTPKKFLRVLSGQRLDWPYVFVSLVDERWVPPDSGRSNARLVAENLLIGPAAAARFIPLYAPGKSIAEGLSDVAAATADLPRPFDAVVLGMGNDGHTASFFPGGDTLAAALEPKTGQTLVAITAPGAGEPRITFTLPELLNTGLLALHIEGVEKAATLERALASGPIPEMPVRAVTRQSATPPIIYWCP